MVRHADVVRQERGDLDILLQQDVPLPCRPNPREPRRHRRQVGIGHLDKITRRDLQPIQHMLVGHAVVQIVSAECHLLPVAVDVRAQCVRHAGRDGRQHTGPKLDARLATGGHHRRRRQALRNRQRLILCE